MEPARLVQFLNKFLSEMTDIILKHGGTIDKYEGDAIIAFWNAPLAVLDHQARGVVAAIECQRRLRQLTKHFMETYEVSIRMRVGLNTGIVTVGNFGSSTRFNYTMIGDAANLASRLEGVNKVFGTTTLVSEATMKGAEGQSSTAQLIWRKLGVIKVVGKEKTVTVWEPLHPELNEFTIVNLGTYQNALSLFEAGRRDEALHLFLSMAEQDPASAAYVRRIRDESGKEGLSSVWELSSK
jgi:adenylate cyclase